VYHRLECDADPLPRGSGKGLKEWQIEHGTRVVYNVTDRERYYSTSR